MKKILVFGVALATLASCGKNPNSHKPDFGDDDGDQIFNFMEVSELDKYVSNFQEITAKKAQITMRFKMPSGDLKVIESEIDFSKNIRQELTKDVFRNFNNPIIGHHSDYFSEFASGKIKEMNKKTLPSEVMDSGAELRISFENNQMNNDMITILKKEKGVFKEIITGKVIGNTLALDNLSGHMLLQEFLGGKELFFSNNSFQGRTSHFFETTINQDMKNKTYRFILSTPKETNIYYVSTELSIQQFLDHLKINLTDYLPRTSSEMTSLYQDSYEIDDRKFLLPINFPISSMNTKMLSGMTYALYAGKVETIRKDYYQMMKEQSSVLARTNDSFSERSFSKEENGELIIEMTMSRQMKNFSDIPYFDTVSGPTPGTIESCRIDTRQITSETTVEATTDSFETLGINFTLDNQIVRPSQDSVFKDAKNQIKRRITFHQRGKNLKIHLKELPKTEKIGCLNDGCTGRSSYPSLCIIVNHSPEGQLSLNYTSYIE